MTKQEFLKKYANVIVDSDDVELFEYDDDGNAIPLHPAGTVVAHFFEGGGLDFSIVNDRGDSYVAILNLDDCPMRRDYEAIA